MQPANANPMLERHAYLWQRLRAWIAEALYQHAGSLEYRTREQLTPLRIWITLIENLLRRLILMAATTAQTDIKPQWRPEPKPEPEPQSELAPETPAEPQAPPTPKPNTAHFRFRLYGIYWPRRTDTETKPTFTGAAPPTATSTQVLFTIRIDIRDPLLNVGDKPRRRKKSRARNANRPKTKRIRGTKHGPDLTVEDFLAWAQANGVSTSFAESVWLEMQKDVARANRAYIAARDAESDEDWRDDEPETESVDTTTPEPAPAPAQPEPEPELISTQPLLDRLTALEAFATNPQKLIQRAMRAFARHREIALRLSQLAMRKQTGLLANSRHLYGTLIPLDAEFRLAMEYFAVSYVEDDSS